VDLFAPGDALVTRDTDTGLDWLDVPLTTNLSFDQVQGGAGGWIAAGWRYATEAEVCHLWTGHGGVPSCNTANLPAPAPPLPPAADVITLLGETEHLFPGGTVVVRTSGLYDDATAPATSVGAGRIETLFVIGGGLVTTTTSAAPNNVASNLASSVRGSFLVRATPPAISALPPVAVASLAALLAFAGRAQLRTRGVR
jgi:hypothetical protein